MSRIIGWEDEFKIIDGERVVTLKDLLPSSHRTFFDQAKHVTLGERKQSLIPEYSDFDDYDTTRTDCIWTWYGGKLYDEQDDLVEASAPPVSITKNPIENLVRMVTMGRAQIGELAGGLPATGVSSQLNFMLDSDLDGEDLCDEIKYVDRNVP
ncbi:MAG: hypothetical protein HW403_457, partial [Dehalococcoidia bacterium]|nr:hypothetical protein [Dehalococcoidia bacterium]